MSNVPVPAAATGFPSRQDLETMIEIAMAILDYLDDDPDVEETGDLEPGTDDEFSLGSLDGAVDQTRWATGAQGDYEGPDSDLEENLSSANPLGARLDDRCQLIVERVPDRQIARRRTAEARS